MSSIHAALAAIASLGPGEDINYSQIAKTYGVVRSTLTLRHQSISSPRATCFENQQVLHPQQEQELLQYIKQLTE
jgi:hypothetical protein